MKLFPKLACAVSLLVVGSTVALSLSFYFAERRAIRAEVDLERRALLQNLVHITQESLLTADDLLLVKYTRWLQKWNPSLASASVVNPKGEVLAHSQPSQIGKSLKPGAPPAGRAEVLVLTQPVHLGGRWVATASAAFSERVFEETVAARLAERAKRLGTIALGGIAAGLLVSFLLALSWTRPVHRLAQAARRVGQGHYDLDLDNTNRRRDELGYLSQSFQRMSLELKELDQMKDDFVSAVTHELRSPLGAIESYLNLIDDEIRDGIPAATWATYSERLKVNIQRLSRFVNDLLDVAAFERGKVTLEAESIDIVQLLQDVAAFYTAKLSERRLRCTVAMPSGPIARAWADPEKIRQVLVNLLTNAIKFTPEGGAIELGIKESPAAKRLRVYVKDNGVGIAPENSEKIFNKFEQVRSARQMVKGPRGTGLGLSICRAILALHGGQLTVESKLGEGSCFIFTLPIAERL